MTTKGRTVYEGSNGWSYTDPASGARCLGFASADEAADIGARRLRVQWVGGAGFETTIARRWQHRSSIPSAVLGLDVGDSAYEIDGTRLTRIR